MIGTGRMVIVGVVLLLLLTAGGASAGVLDEAVFPEDPGSTEVPGEMGVLFARSLASLEAPAALVSAAEDEDLDRAWPYVRAVGDLDGDGLPDIVSVAHTQAATSDDRELVLVARRGIDGTVLFTHRRPGAGWDTVIPARVGDGSPGLLLVRYRGTGLVDGPPRGEDPHGITNYGVNVQLEIAALDGTGEVVWERTFAPGQYAYPGTQFDGDDPPMAAVARDVAVFSGLLDGPDATDVLVGVYDRTSTPAVQEGSLRAVVIAGTDGSDRSETSVDITDALTALAPAGDVTGDGRDDYALLVEEQGEAGESALRAYAATDGAELWTAALARRQALFTFIRPVGDMTGDGTAELALTTHPWLTPTNPTDDTADLVAGATGEPLRNIDADDVVELGDITGDGRSEVATWTAVASEGHAGVRYTAYAAAGPPVYEAEHLVARTGQPGSVRVLRVGDIDGDGVPDLAQEVPLGDGQVDSRIISGRDATVVRHGALGGAPAGGSVGGDGDDFVAANPWGRSVRDIAAVDGRSGDALWTTRLRPRGQDAGSTNATVVDLTGDGHGEVILTVGSTTVGYDVPSAAAYDVERFRDAYVLSGADGSVLWQTDPDAPLEEATVDGEVDPATTFAWEGSTGPGFVWGPVQAGDCAVDEPTAPCERLLLRLSNPPTGSETSRTATAVVEIADFAPAPAPLTDFDLYVFESDAYGTRGRELGRSTNWFDPHDEQVAFPLVTTAAQPSQFVLVEVVAYDNPTGSSYQGAAWLD